MGFTSIAVDSLNSIAQLAAVLKCMARQRNFSLVGFNHRFVIHSSCRRHPSPVSHTHASSPPTSPHLVSPRVTSCHLDRNSPATTPTNCSRSNTDPHQGMQFTQAPCAEASAQGPDRGRGSRERPRGDAWTPRTRAPSAGTGAPCRAARPDPATPPPRTRRRHRKRGSRPLRGNECFLAERQDREPRERRYRRPRPNNRSVHTEKARSDAPFLIGGRPKHR